MKNKFAVLSAILLFLIAGKICSQDFLKVSGTRIVNSKGDEIILRGMGLGGWMLQEGYMLKINGQGMQHLIKARITDLIGKEKCDLFYEQWHLNHMRKADVDSLARWGFNSIRLPMHYNLYTLPIEEEPVKGENTWLKKGFEMTDSLLSWCRANNIRLILDLHAAPGGQGKDANISDYDTTKPSLWESELNKQKTIALWRKLAERYVNDPYIGGYDLLNEPNWTFEGKNRNGLDDSKNGPIWDLYKEITAAIRQVDKNHIIIIEGNGWGNNYRGFPGTWDNNMVFSFHKYWNANNQQDISGILALRDQYKIPLWLGESGENSDNWFTDCISLAEKNGIGWSWWPLKKIGSVICPLLIKVPAGYDNVVDYWNGKGERPSKELAERALFEAAENLKAENCRFNKDIIDAMFRQVNDKSARAFADNVVPGRLYASDYDLGYSGSAYHDRDNERTGEPDKRAGNKGRTYRNEGPDIEMCSDAPDETNGYNIFSIDDGEWLSYSVNVKKDGEYKLRLRTEAGEKPAAMHIECDGSAAAGQVTIPASDGKQNWKTIEAGTIKLSEGKHTIKLVFDKGGFKLSYLEVK